jgi:hypothetical protein
MAPDRGVHVDRLGIEHHPSGNLPRFDRRDIAGILLAILGTAILIVLAALCDDTSTSGHQGADSFTQFAGGCAARFLIATGAALISLAHVVGLVLMESVGYRGVWERFFAKLILIGMPVAIVVSLLVG